MSLAVRSARKWELWSATCARPCAKRPDASTCLSNVPVARLAGQRVSVTRCSRAPEAQTRTTSLMGPLSTRATADHAGTCAPGRGVADSRGRSAVARAGHSDV